MASFPEPWAGSGSSYPFGADLNSLQDVSLRRISTRYDALSCEVVRDAAAQASEIVYGNLLETPDFIASQCRANLTDSHVFKLR